jgi:hypothetical protein
MTHENKGCTENHLQSRCTSHCGAHPSCILFYPTPDCDYFLLNCFLTCRSQNRAASQYIATQYRAASQYIATQYCAASQYIATQYRAASQYIATQYRAASQYIATQYRAASQYIATQHRAASQYIATQHRDASQYIATQHCAASQYIATQDRAASQYISIVNPTRCSNFSNLFYFLDNTLHVSDGLSVHHQEFKTVHTATGMCMANRYCYLLASKQTAVPV